MSVQTIEFPLDVELLPVRPLAAGKLTCLYENGNLRYIRYGGEEVLRMIYTAVRDQDWATAPYEIEDEKIDESGDGFFISYTAVYRLKEIHYKAAIQIKGTADGLQFSMEGEALRDFLRNRIGLCVLHPINEWAGRKVKITHPNGTVDDAVFPERISPHQPFLDIQAMQWSSGSATVTLEFEGDVFETEDQRNWTDFSYKTYSTPLDKPRPVQVEKGDKISQKVTAKLSPNSGTAPQKDLIIQPTTATKRPFPKIGYERSKGSPRLSADELSLLEQIPFDHYRVNLYLSEPGWMAELQTAAAEAAQLGAGLELVVFVHASTGEGLQQLAEALRGYAIQILSILLLEEGKGIVLQPLLQAVYVLFKQALPDVKIGYGTDAFFAELNRNRPSPDLPFDFLSFSLNPQVHAVDTRTLLENLAAQAETIRTIKTFAPQQPIYVSPITFKYREPQSLALIMIDEDPRMYTAFGAMWSLLTIKNLAGADRLSFYQAKSYRGVLNEHIAPDNNPLYQVLKQVKRFAPKWIVDDPVNPFMVVLENEQGDQLAFVLKVPFDEHQNAS